MPRDASIDLKIGKATLGADDYIELIRASKALRDADSARASALARLRSFPADAILGKQVALIIADDTLCEDVLRRQTRKLHMAVRVPDPIPGNPDITVVYPHRPVLIGLGPEDM